MSAVTSSVAATRPCSPLRPPARRCSAPSFKRCYRLFPPDLCRCGYSAFITLFCSNRCFPTALCKINYDDNFILASIQPLEDAWSVNKHSIPLRIMSLTPNQNPAHAKPDQLTVEIEGRTCQLDLKSERPLLTNLRALLTRYDPDLLLTTWGDTWLLPLLLEKAQQYHIDLPLNREPGRQIRWQKERSFFSYGQIVYRGQQIHLFGRCHIDRHNAGFWKDYELDGILEACRVTSLPLQTSARTSPGTGISSIEILTALQEGILVPWQKQQAEMVKRQRIILWLTGRPGLPAQGRCTPACG